MYKKRVKDGATHYMMLCLILMLSITLEHPRRILALQRCLMYAVRVRSGAGVKNPEAALCAPDQQHASVGISANAELELDMGEDTPIVDGPGLDFYIYEQASSQGIELDSMEVGVAPDTSEAMIAPFVSVFVWGDTNQRNNGTIPASYLPEDPNRIIKAADLHAGAGVGIDIGRNDGARYRFVRFRPFPIGHQPNNTELVQIDAIERLEHHIPTVVIDPSPSTPPSATAEPTATLAAQITATTELQATSTPPIATVEPTATSLIQATSTPPTITAEPTATAIAASATSPIPPSNTPRMTPTKPAPTSRATVTVQPTPSVTTPTSTSGMPSSIAITTIEPTLQPDMIATSTPNSLGLPQPTHVTIESCTPVNTPMLSDSATDEASAPGQPIVTPTLMPRPQQQAPAPTSTPMIPAPEEPTKVPSRDSDPAASANPAGPVPAKEPGEANLPTGQATNNGDETCSWVLEYLSCVLKNLLSPPTVAGSLMDMILEYILLMLFALAVPYLKLSEPPSSPIGHHIRININTTDLPNLERQLKAVGLRADQARAIIDYRQHHRFTTIEEVMLVKGIKEKTFQSIKEWIDV